MPFDPTHENMANLKLSPDQPVEVLAADLRLAEPRYVTLPNMMKAKKKPVDAVEAADVADIGKRTLDLQEVIEPPARSAGVKLNSVDELIDVLKNTAKVL